MKSSKHSLGNVILRLGSFGSTTSKHNFLRVNAQMYI